MNRQIVIKVIKRSLLDQPGALECFRREIQAAAQLSHPNIVTAYDAEQDGEMHMLVMEFVPGQSLAEEPKRRYQKPEEVVLALAPFIKPGAKGNSPPALDVGSPVKGTVIETESEIEKIERVAPRPARPKNVPAKVEKSLYADRTEETVSPNEAERLDDETMPSQPKWWKRPGVLAGAFGASLALIVMIVVLIIATIMQNPGTATNKTRTSTKTADAPEQLKPQNNEIDIKLPPREPKREPRKSEQEKKRTALDKGVIALRKMQRADDTWPHDKIGATALAGLTLLECGAPADDTSVQLAADAVRPASLKLTHTYSIALSILFLDRLGDPDDIPLIEPLTVRLLAGQSTTGGWSYDCPAISDAEVRRLADKLAQRSEPSGPRKPSEPGVRKRTFKDLPKVIQQQVTSIRVNGIETKKPDDNSNTQFAILGLWVGRRYGLPVERALRSVEIRFRNTQQADGGWMYVNLDPKVKGSQPSSTAAMTCAGLFGLAIANGAKLEIKKERNPRNKEPFNIDKDANLRQGLLALNTFIAQPREEENAPRDRSKVAQIGGRSYYFLWALERMAVALDLKKVGKTDWYESGVELLLANHRRMAPGKTNTPRAVRIRVSPFCFLNALI